MQTLIQKGDCENVETKEYQVIDDQIIMLSDSEVTDVDKMIVDHVEQLDRAFEYYLKHGNLN